MRVVMWLSLPVAIFAVALLYTIVTSWTQGVPFCATWVSSALPVCR